MVRFVPPFMPRWRFQKQALWTIPPSSFPWISPTLNLPLHLCQRYRSMDHNLWPSYWRHKLTDGRHLFISPPPQSLRAILSVGETNRESKTETLPNSRKKKKKTVQVRSTEAGVIGGESRSARAEWNAKVGVVIHGLIHDGLDNDKKNK